MRKSWLRATLLGTVPGGAQEILETVTVIKAPPNTYGTQNSGPLKVLALVRPKVTVTSVAHFEIQVCTLL